MTKKKGDIKTGGRQKGTPNKATSMTKEFLNNFLSDYAASGLMQSDFAQLEPRDRLTLAEKFVQYIMPKMQSVAVAGEGEKPVTIEARLQELAKIPGE